MSRYDRHHQNNFKIVVDYLIEVVYNTMYGNVNNNFKLKGIKMLTVWIRKESVIMGRILASKNIVNKGDIQRLMKNKNVFQIPVKYLVK